MYVLRAFFVNPKIISAKAPISLLRYLNVAHSFIATIGELYADLTSVNLNDSICAVLMAFLSLLSAILVLHKLVFGSLSVTVS
ncbi:hypothetical protein TUM3792_16290 [Shewanella sp. MBTL60-007]|nr:hypothetical protein TUM3792_16290 [Shewanella sp. MBTL60-007]